MYVISHGLANPEAVGPLKWPVSTTGGKWMFGSHWSLLGHPASAFGEVELITVSTFIFSTDHAVPDEQGAFCRTSTSNSQF